jgi:ribonuclease-3
MNELEEKIGYNFNDPQLLITALSHSSYVNERKIEGESCNERLEFLGDSILGMVTADFLYRRYPDLPEGKMTKTRAELVCEHALYIVAQKIDLGRSILLGRGEEQGGGRRRPSILSDAVEAVIAAIYLDGGLEQASKFIYTFVLSEIEHGLRSSDYKTELQELVQRRKGEQKLKYAMLGASGPDHERVFTFRVSLNGEQIGIGTGRSKKEAEQNAAKQALEALKHNA